MNHQSPRTFSMNTLSHRTQCPNEFSSLVKGATKDAPTPLLLPAHLAPFAL